MPTEGHAQTEHDYSPAQRRPAPQPPREGAAPAQPASDFMVDVLKKLDFDYAAINPGSAFAGLHESLLNYGGNQTPEILTSLHEEAAVAMAHGYAKAAGKPMLVCAHGTVGIAPLVDGALPGLGRPRSRCTSSSGMHRNPAGIINLPHSAQDMGSIVRDFVKFDDETTDARAVCRVGAAGVPDRAHATDGTRSPGRRRRTAGRAGHGQGTASHSGSSCEPRRLRATRTPSGKPLDLLVNAEAPILLPRNWRRTPKGWDLMLELAELLAGSGGRRNVRILAGLSLVASALGEWWGQLSGRRLRSGLK